MTKFKNSVLITIVILMLPFLTAAYVIELITAGIQGILNWIVRGVVILLGVLKLPAYLLVCIVRSIVNKCEMVKPNKRRKK